jgi:hypothetical protein
VIQGSHKHLPHTDSPPRRWVLNYMWETGGNNVRTQIYHERGQLLERQAMLHNNLVAHLSKPKEVMRDDNGKIIGVK